MSPDENGIPGDEASTGNEASPGDITVGAPAGRRAEPTTDTGAGTTPSGRLARPRSETTRLADGLVDAPAVRHTDPESALLSDPVVAEGKRYCGSCAEPVGRSTPSGPGSARGVCPTCGTAFDFTPMLSPGELVAGQYEVRGCLAHGGLGWIYLARDRNVADRWVVLKGLLHSQDPAAQAVALAERRFLAELSHPSIVGIHNFVEHPNGRGKPVGYIVMEFIGGTTLKHLRGGRRMPVEYAIAYVLGILPALGYMHAGGLVYNDLKPENIMVDEDRLTLIDMGAVAGIGDYGYIYGTRGFQAPEIMETGPTPATDVYTVGRTLAVLTAEIGRDRGRYIDAVPTPDDEPVFAEHEFFYRLLMRCLDPDPDQRYPTADALARGLRSILRGIVSARTGTPHPAISTLFSPPRSTYGTALAIARTDRLLDERREDLHLRPEVIARALPVPLVPPEDPATADLASTVHAQPEEVLDMLGRVRVDAEPEVRESIEIPLAEVRAYLDLDEPDQALGLLGRTRNRHLADWRFEWLAGLAELRRGEYEAAFTNFDAVLTAVPGEAAPKLATAATAEIVLDRWETDHPAAWRDLAERHYRRLWQTDLAIVSAAFGLARQLIARGGIADAVAALDEVPVGSRHHDEAQMTAVLALVDQREIAAIGESELVETGERIARLPADDRRTLQLRALALGVAVEWLRTGHTTGQARFLGVRFTEPGLRGGTERTLRTLARSMRDTHHRYRLVDLANRVRPRTWL